LAIGVLSHLKRRLRRKVSSLHQRSRSDPECSRNVFDSTDQRPCKPSLTAMTCSEFPRMQAVNRTLFLPEAGPFLLLAVVFSGHGYTPSHRTR
jgi:hypothetical protein